MVDVLDPPLANIPRLCRDFIGRRVAILAIVLVGFALRLYHLDADGLWFDEIGQAAVSMYGVKGALLGASLHNGAAPADYLLTWLALRVAHNDFIVRLPAVFLGTLTLVLLYQLGCILFDRTTGTLAALFLAAAPLHLRYSQEARFYALFTCLAVGTSLALLMALRQGGWRRWAVYTLLLALALYAHYFMPLVVLMQGMVVVVTKLYPWIFPVSSIEPNTPNRVSWKPLAAFITSCAVAALAFLPWFSLVVLAETGMPRATPPEISLLLAQSILSELVLGPGTEYSQALPFWLAWLYLALAVIGSLVGLSRRKTRIGALYATGIIVVLPLLVNLVIHLINYLFAMRQVLFVLPFFLLLVSFGALSLIRLTRRLTPLEWHFPIELGMVLIAAFVLIWPLRPAVELAYIGHRFEWGGDWKNAMAFIDANAQPDEVVVAEDFPRYYLYYYAPNRIHQMLRVDERQGVGPIVSAHSTGWIVTLIPERLASTLDSVTSIEFDFGPLLSVVYWSSDEDEPSLMATVAQWVPPTNPRALTSLAQQLGASGEEDRAAEYFSQAEALAQDDETLRTILFVQADSWRKEGDRQRAIQSYQRITERWPLQYEAWVRLGEGLLMADQIDAASDALQRALQIEPGHFWAHLYLGQVRQRQGDYLQAAASFRAALSIEPENAHAYELLGDTALALGDNVGAIAAYEKCLELASTDSQSAKCGQKLTSLLTATKQ